MEIREEHVYELHRVLIEMAINYERLARDYPPGSWYNGFYRGSAKSCRRNARYMLQLTNGQV